MPESLLNGLTDLQLRDFFAYPHSPTYTELVLTEKQFRRTAGADSFRAPSCHDLISQNSH